MPTPEKVAIPLTALTVVRPTVVPLPLTVMVTEAVLLVTVLPKASLMVMMGWVVKAEPLALPFAAVVNVARVAMPKVGVMVCAAVAKEPEVKVRVYAVPAAPLIPTPEKVATPLTAATVVRPKVVAPVLTVMVTEAALLVTVLPKESLMVMMGCVVNAEPLGAPAAWVVSVAWVAVPKVGVMAWVAEVKPLEVKLSV